MQTETIDGRSSESVQYRPGAGKRTSVSAAGNRCKDPPGKKDRTLRHAHR